MSEWIVSFVPRVSLNAFLLFKPFENSSDYYEKNTAYLRGNYKDIKLTTKLLLLVVFENHISISTADWINPFPIAYNQLKY